MRDISKRLTVINTGKKESEAGAASQPSGVVYVGAGGGGGGGNLNDYLLKSIWNKVWEIRTDSQGTEYIFGKLPVVTQYGLTMYSGDNVNIPTIAEGLPFDQRTIWLNPTTGQIEVIGGTGGGGGSEGGVSNFWDLSGIPSWITNTKPTYSYSEIQGTPDLSKYALASDIPSLSGYATEQWVLGRGFALSSDLSKYIPIAGATDITGEKNFIGGLKVNGSPIYYDTENKYWKLEGDLLVTGGVTMYGNDSDFVPSTIMDAILYDDTTLGINAQGQLYVKGGTGATTMGSLSNVGSWADSVASQDRIMYQAANSSHWVAKNLSDLAVGGVTGNYLPLNMTSTPFVVNTQSGVVNFKSTSASEVGFRLYFGDSNKGGLWANDERIYLYHAPTGNSIALTTGGRLIFKSGGVDYTVLHSENYNNYALPLSGGTLTNTLTINSDDVVLKVFRTKNASVPYIRFGASESNEYGEIGVHYDTGNPVFWNTKAGSTKWEKIWYEGNDGSGSGLDADLLDGFHVNDSQKPYGKIPLIGADGVMEVGKYIDFHNDNTTGSDFSTRLYCSGEHANNVSLPSASGTLALTSSNVASATKLATARTIWGQSFDGTGNVDGVLTINKDTTSSGDYGACVLINGNYAETGFHRALSYENQKMAVGSTAAMYVGAKNNQYNGGYIGFKYVGANSSSNYMSIGLYAANDLLCVLGNGNVGIGTTSPLGKLQINHSGFADGLILRRTSANAGTSVRFYSNDTQLGYIGINGSKTILFGVDLGTDLVTIDYNGNMLVKGGITMYSDARKKTILNHVELSLQQVANAPLIEHYYNSDQNKTTHVGSIAQYWAEMNDWFCKKDSEGFYTMEIQNAALASAISVARELVKFETETDRRIRLLEEENKRLKEEVEQLKWNIA